MRENAVLRGKGSMREHAVLPGTALNAKPPRLFWTVQNITVQGLVMNSVRTLLKWP